MILANVRASLERDDAQLALRLIAGGSGPELDQAEAVLRDSGIDALLDDPRLVAASLDIARHQWEAAQRRLEGLRGDPRASARAYTNLELVTVELRRRLGGSFTLDELAGVYERAEDWARALLEERGTPGWPAQLTLVVDAAFGMYAHSASDYRP